MGIQGNFPINSASPINYPDSQQPATEKSSGKKILSSVKGQVTGKVSSFLSLPDKYPKLRVVFDIGIIALAVISIIAVLAASGGQGLMLFAIIPGVIFAGLGLSLLISDVAKNPKTIMRAQKIAAILTPILLVGAAAALFVSAFYIGGMGVMLVATPQFMIGLILVGLSLISVNKVTAATFKNLRSQSNKSTKTLVVPKIDSQDKISEIDKKRKQNLDRTIKAAMQRYESQLNQKRAEKIRSRRLSDSEINTRHNASYTVNTATGISRVNSEPNIDFQSELMVNNINQNPVPNTTPSPLFPPVASSLQSIATTSVAGKSKSSRIKPVKNTEKGKPGDDEPQKEDHQNKEPKNKEKGQRKKK